MNHEQQRHQHPEEGEQRAPAPSSDAPEADPQESGRQDPSGRHPGEQVGYLYAVDLEPGQSAEIRKLPEPPRIWVGSWLDYNNGLLHGEWIDAARDETEVWADISAMLAASPTARQHGEVAEDWGIFDHDNFGLLKIGEQETVSS